MTQVLQYGLALKLVRGKDRSHTRALRQGLESVILLCALSHIQTHMRKYHSLVGLKF